MAYYEKEFRIQEPGFDFKPGDKVVLTPEGIATYTKYGLGGIMNIVSISFHRLSKINIMAYLSFDGFSVGYTFKNFKHCRSTRIEKLLKDI